MDIKISGILADNDAAYFNYLETKIREVDPDARIVASESVEGIVIYIMPSDRSMFIKETIVKAVRKVHYTMGLRIEFSKSLLISKNVVFKIPLNNFI